MPIPVILDCDSGHHDATPNAFRVLELLTHRAILGRSSSASRGYGLG